MKKAQDISLEQLQRLFLDSGKVKNVQSVEIAFLTHPPGYKANLLTALNRYNTNNNPQEAIANLQSDLRKLKLDIRIMVTTPNAVLTVNQTNGEAIAALLQPPSDQTKVALPGEIIKGIMSFVFNGNSNAVVITFSNGKPIGLMPR